MGKLHISEDLKSKLDKVLSIKDIDNSNENKVVEGKETTQKILEIKVPEQKIKRRIHDLNYIELIKFVFVTSFVGGIGLTFGMKIGKIIFY